MNDKIYFYVCVRCGVVHPIRLTDLAQYGPTQLTCNYCTYRAIVGILYTSEALAKQASPRYKPKKERRNHV